MILDQRMKHIAFTFVNLYLIRRCQISLHQVQILAAPKSQEMRASVTEISNMIQINTVLDIKLHF